MASIAFVKTNYIIVILIMVFPVMDARKIDLKVSGNENPKEVIAILVAIFTSSLVRGIFNELKIPVPVMLITTCFGYCWGNAARYYPSNKELSSLLYINKNFYGNVVLTFALLLLIVSSNIRVLITYWRTILLLGFTVIVINVLFVAAFLTFLIPHRALFVDCLYLAILMAMSYCPEAMDILEEANFSMKKCISSLKADTVITFFMGYQMITLTSNYLTKLDDKDPNFYTDNYFWFYCVGGILGAFIFGHILARAFNLMYQHAGNLIILCLVMFCITVGIFRNESLEVPFFLTVVMITIVSIYIAFHRARLKTEVDTFLILVLYVIGFFVRSVIFFIMGATMAALFTEEADLYDYANIFVIYIVTNVGRTLSYWLMSPLLHNVNNGMSYKEIQVVSWAFSGSPICQLIVSEDFDNYYYKLYVFYITGATFLNLLINMTTLPIILKIMGFYNITPEKEANMKFCLKYVLSKRNQAIILLKMDKFLDGANYRIIREHTMISHPYHKKMILKDIDDSYTILTRFVICADCLKEFPKRLSSKEYYEIVKDTRIRILQAEKVSYARQYENGMISKKAAKILSRNVDAALQTDDKIKKIDDILKTFKSEGKFSELRRKFFIAIFAVPEDDIRPPRTYCRKACYRIITSKSYDIFFYILCILSVIPAIIETFLHDMYHDTPELVITDITVEVVVLLFFIVEFILKIIAYSWIHQWTHGLRKYFKYNWNRYDFAMLVLTAGDVLLITPLTHSMKTSGSFIHHTIAYKIILLSRLFRLLKITKYCKICCLNRLKYLNSKVDSNLALAYILGKGHLTSDSELVDTIDLIIEDRQIVIDTKKRIETHKRLLTNELCILQAKLPGLAVTLKTKMAMTTILCTLRSHVTELKASGALDAAECQKLIEVLDQKFNYVKDIKFIEPCSPKAIFNEVIWLKGPDQVGEFLYENARTKVVSPGEAVITEDSFTEGVFIIVSGVMKVKYEPNEDLINAYEDFGALPVIDYISSINFLRPIEDFVVAGNSVGTRGIVSGRRYNCSIVAETTTVVLFLTRKVMHTALEMNSDPITGLEARIWKAISFIFAEKLLRRSPGYQSFNKENIKLVVERGFTPSIDLFKTFMLNDDIEDVILLEGVAADFHTREMFSAPCCLPRTTQQILFPKSSLMTFFTEIVTRLMIIPAKDVNIDNLMRRETSTSQLVSTSKNKCILHVAYSNLVNTIEKQTGLYSGKRKTRMLTALDESFKDLFDRPNEAHLQSDLNTVLLLTGNHQTREDGSSSHVDLFRKEEPVKANSKK